MCTLVVSVLFIIPLIVLGLYLVFKRRLFENYFNLDLSKGQLIPSFFTLVYRILWIAGFKKQGVLSKKWYKSVKLAEENNRSKLVSLQTKLDAEWDNVELVDASYKLLFLAQTDKYLFLYEKSSSACSSSHHITQYQSIRYSVSRNGILLVCHCVHSLHC